MNKYVITTMGEKMIILAEDRKTAYVRFFLGVKNGKYPLDKIGGIIMVTGPNGDEYPLRTTPILWLMDLIPAGVAFATIEKMLNLDSRTDESATLLLSGAKGDSWILQAIKDLEEQERIKNT